MQEQEHFLSCITFLSQAFFLNSIKKWQHQPPRPKWMKAKGAKRNIVHPAAAQQKMTFTYQEKWSQSIVCISDHMFQKEENTIISIFLMKRLSFG